MNPRVTAVTASTDYRLHLVFTSGEKRVFDCTPLLDFGVFTELKEPGYFGAVQVVDGTVVWPHEQDICPDTLYAESRAE